MIIAECELPGMMTVNASDDCKEHLDRWVLGACARVLREIACLFEQGHVFWASERTIRVGQPRAALKRPYSSKTCSFVNFQSPIFCPVFAKKFTRVTTDYDSHSKIKHSQLYREPLPVKKQQHHKNTSERTGHNDQHSRGDDDYGQEIGGVKVRGSKQIIQLSTAFSE